MKTSLKRIAAVCAALLLAACEPGDFVSVGPSSDVANSVQVRNGGVTIAAPSGFCIDDGMSKPAEGFVVLGGCVVITRGKAFGPVNNAIIVVSVSEDRADALAGTKRLASMVGGNALVTKYEEGVSLVQLETGGDAYIPNGEPKHWHGIATVNGYFVLMSVYSEVGGTASRKSGGDLILSLAQNIRLNSPFRMLPKPPKLRPS